MDFNFLVDLSAPGALCDSLINQNVFVFAAKMNFCEELVNNYVTTLNA